MWWWSRRLLSWSKSDIAEWRTTWRGWRAMPRSTITFHNPYNDVGGILILVVCSNLYPPGITFWNVRFSLSADYLSECRTYIKRTYSWFNMWCRLIVCCGFSVPTYFWITSLADNQPQTCVLDGLAGTGKFTVAGAVAEEAHKHSWLGASFFSRSEGDRKSAKLLLGTLVIV